jgi:hypothetical protein
MIKLDDLSIVDLYEAWRVGGKVWLHSWSGDVHLVRFETSSIRDEIKERGYSMTEAIQEWRDARDSASGLVTP